LRLFVGLASVGLLLTACSSSSSSGTTTTAVGATGTPIPVGQIYPATGANLALPEAGNSLKASIAGLNSAGGINGHPLKLIQCDSQGDANIEVQCAQTMVQDHVVATLEDSTFSNPAQVNSILEAAGIPRIGLTKADVTDYSNPDNFDFTGGGILSLVGIMDDLINKGDKKLSVVVPDEPQSAQTHLLLDPIAKAEGATVVNYVLVSSASGDYSQYVAQAEQNGSQGMVLALANAQLVQMAQVINQLSPTIDYATGIAGFTLTQLKGLGTFAKKASFVWWTPGIDDVKNFPGLQQPIDTLTANMQGATVDNMTSTSLGSWLAVHAFDEVMKSQTGTVTAASVLAAFNAAKDIPMNGIVSPWTPSADQNAGSLSSVFKNVSNPYMYRITFNGTNTQTSPSQLFNTLAGLTPGTAAASG
jgi:ABC-type branched-subunit amino acid transport system substrate-binding protein